jgi:acyl-CoA thioesterase-2
MVDLEHLLSILNLEELDAGLFRGQILMPDRPHVYGGQVLAQALEAATRTVPEQRRVHSMHAYFLRPGDHQHPIIYDVEAIRDGGSFTTRRVVAKQHGKAIFISSMSFKAFEKGFEHQADMPDVPQPESLESDLEYWKRIDPKHFRQRMLAIETRSINRIDPSSLEASEPVNGLWFKPSGPIPSGSTMNEVLIAFASDLSFMGTSFRPHPINFQTKGLQAASIDHTIWFHTEITTNDWLYYHMDSPRASNATGFNRGSIYTRNGILIASTAQEGLMRVRQDQASQEKPSETGHHAHGTKTSV